MVIQGIYVQGYSMYECTGIQAYSFTFGATALQCIALYRYTVIHQRSFCNLFCGCHLYNSILSMALQVIFKSKARVAMFGILQMWLNAQQILLCQWAGNARQISRHLTILYAHFSFPFFQRFATVGRRKCSRPETDAMSCHSSSKAQEASEMP